MHEKKEDGNDSKDIIADYFPLVDKPFKYRRISIKENISLKDKFIN